MKKVVVIFGILCAVGFHLLNQTPKVSVSSFDSGRENGALPVFDKLSTANTSEFLQIQPVNVAHNLRNVDRFRNISIEEVEAKIESDKVVSKLNNNLTSADERNALFKRLEDVNTLRKRQIEKDLAKIERDFEALENIQRERFASFGAKKQ